MAANDNAGQVTRMEEKLDELEQQLQCHYCDMGKSILEMARQEQREINRLVDEIIKTRKALAQARCEVQCEECMAFNPPDSRYCRRCGARLAEGSV